jgi:hypothetical protein
MMTSLQERIGGERRRMREVRLKLSAAVAQSASGNTDWAPFYIAVGDYMELSMGRMRAQDIKMGDRVREKMESVDDNFTQSMSRLHDRLSGLEQRLSRMLAARESLRSDAATALNEFEDAARDLTGYIVSNLGKGGLGHQEGGLNGLAAKLFGPEDWEFMAGITDEDLAREVALFENVNATMPPDLELPPAE